MRFKILTAARMNMTALWDIAPRILVKVYRLSEVHTAFIIALMKEAVPSLKRRSSPTRLHSAISQKAVTFNKYPFGCFALLSDKKLILRYEYDVSYFLGHNLSAQNFRG
jgi:hypothetical protein